MGIVLLLVAAAGAMQLTDHLYYNRYSKKLNNFPKSNTIREARKYLAQLNGRKLDDLFSVFPFVWSYLYIISAILVSTMISGILVKVVLILFVTGRFRTLQEAGHFAVHGALSKHMKFGLFLANIFYQFPVFMPEAGIRRDTHVRRHHNSVNMPHDPDLKELEDKNFRPGLTSFKFWLGVFYPITPRGVFDRVKECGANVWADRGQVLHISLRAIVVGVILAIFSYFGLYEEMILFYIIPVLITYPLFYWIAHISLHRWYEKCPEGIDYDSRELVLGRPTEFPGILGLIVRNNVFPLGDSYHLAHSLFPTVRWNHLPMVDKYLKSTFPVYSENITHGLLASSAGRQSILSSLKKTIVSR
ncbi:fatty acid desaturase family protein [Burkholderia contaminans]|uniref:fatty acid desaturase family protein n=1 Tax=Burkholderia contaminans TaxID=488447 RepID=UPI001FC82BE6|nr:fatty acid desaturase [Burkholderia contaminans]